jgi:uncharacterized membrane protein YqjE
MSELERVGSGNGAGPSFGARLDRLVSSVAELFSTRTEIFGKELSEKASHLVRGTVAAVAAAILGFLAFLLLAVLVAAFFAALFGSAWAGALAALVLYGGAAAAAAVLAVRAFGRVRPMDFPITGRELAKDWEAARQAAGIAAAEPESPETSATCPAPVAEDFEERLRRGLE